MTAKRNIRNQIKKFIKTIRSSVNTNSEPDGLLEVSAGVFDDTNAKNNKPERASRNHTIHPYIGAEKMREMIKSMEELKESNDTVFKIISVIDDMAFQTNLLVINAMAEAARTDDDAG